MSEENVEIVRTAMEASMRREGRVVSIQGFIDPAAALEAAGLPD